MVLANTTLNGLKEMGLLDEDIEARLKYFVKLLNSLIEISIKELRGEELTEEEYSIIRGYGGALNYLLSIAGPKTKDPRVIADVFTDPNTNRVLEVGTGYFDYIIIVYKTPKGDLYAGLGFVMSYYEFTWPQQNRLTDEEWRNMLETNPPQQPAWVTEFKVFRE